MTLYARQSSILALIAQEGNLPKYLRASPHEMSSSIGSPMTRPKLVETAHRFFVAKYYDLGDPPDLDAVFGDWFNTLNFPELEQIFIKQQEKYEKLVRKGGVSKKG